MPKRIIRISFWSVCSLC